jgi:hypothetical protein
MHAQLIESATTPDRVDELSEVIRRELVVALRGQEGFSGALSLLDRATGTGLLVVLWETGEEAARPLVQCGAPLLAALAAVAEVSTGALRASTVWEVSARG